MCRNVHVSKFNIWYVGSIQLYAGDEASGSRPNIAVPYSFTISNYVEHGPPNSELSETNNKLNAHEHEHSKSTSLG